MLDGRNQTRPKIWLILGAVIAVAVVLLVVLLMMNAAAIVLREGVDATEREIRDFCAGRLADFKVPRRIVILAEIPKGATGKLQRIGLAAKLGLG